MTQLLEFFYASASRSTVGRFPGSFSPLRLALSVFPVLALAPAGAGVLRTVLVRLDALCVLPAAADATAASTTVSFADGSSCVLYHSVCLSVC